jgi:hypothetical protein
MLQQQLRLLALASGGAGGGADGPSAPGTPTSTPAPLRAPAQVPELVAEYMSGKTMLDKYVTHDLKFDQINEAFELLHSGQCLRCVLTF